MKNNKPQILIVEDEKSLLKAWVKKFERQGFKALTAVNGAAAFALALLYPPDVVVVDIVMPSTDGLILIKKLRENKRLSKIPVMFLSNWPEGEPDDLLHIANNENFLYNWNPEEVIEKVKNKVALGV
jgi:DNA-binding response OmpR family regulator